MKIQTVQFSKAVYTADQVENLLPKISDLKNYCEQHGIRLGYNDNKSRKDNWVDAILKDFKRHGLTGVAQTVSADCVGKVYRFPEYNNAIVNVISVFGLPDFGKVKPGEVTPIPRRVKFTSDASYWEAVEYYKKVHNQELEADRRYKASLNLVVLGVDQTNGIAIQLAVRPNTSVYECLSEIKPLFECSGFKLGDKIRSKGSTNPSEIKAIYQVDGRSLWARLDCGAFNNVLPVSLLDSEYIPYIESLADYPKKGVVSVIGLQLKYESYSPETMSVEITPFDKTHFITLTVRVEDGSVAYSTPFTNNVSFYKLKAIASFMTAVANLGDDYFLNLLNA